MVQLYTLVALTTVTPAPPPPLRFQVDEIAQEGAEPGSSKSYKVSLIQMAADDDTNLLVDQPEGVNPMFSRALNKRASM